MAAGVVTSGSFAKALWPGIHTWYQNDYDEWPTEYTDLFSIVTSRQQFEETVGVSEFGLPAVKDEGAGIEYDDTEQNFVARFIHKVYGKGFIVTREMNEDDLYGVVGRREARALSRAMRIGKEVVHANVLNNGFDSNFTMAGAHDGVELFSSVHPNGPYGGTFQNELTTTADLSEAALEDLMIEIDGATDARGLQMVLRGVSLNIPRQLRFIAHRILDSVARVGTADNDANVLGDGDYLPEGINVNHYFTDTDAWFVKTNAREGLTCFQRRPMQFEPDNDFDTENAKYKSTERYSTGWSDPRGIFGVQGA